MILRSTEDLSTLEPHAYRNVVNAGRGGHGSSNNRAGERGKDAVLEVPVGTQAFDGDGLLADLSEPGETFTATGGEGGRGNGSFATSTARRRHSGRGDCQARSVRSVSSSRSSRTSASSACPTREVFAAPSAKRRPSEGGRLSFHHPLAPARGRGREGLPRTVRSRHPWPHLGGQRGQGPRQPLSQARGTARLLALVLDASEDPEGAEGTLRAELHAARLSEKPTVVVLNKVDLLDEELRAYLRETFPDAPQVSATTEEGVAALRDTFERRLREMGEHAVSEVPEHRVFRPTWKGVRVEHENGGYVVSGRASSGSPSRQTGATGRASSAFSTSCRGSEYLEPAAGRCGAWR